MSKRTVQIGNQLTLSINPDQNTPLWRQLYEQIVTAIMQGILSGGVDLPPERDLAEQLNLSRGTVRRCYSELRAKNQLSGRGRAGSKLNTPEKVYPILGQLKSFTQEMAELGKTASTYIEYLAIEPNPQIAQIFARPHNTEFLHIIRIRSGDNIPMSREVAWYDIIQAPLLRQWNGNGSIYAFLEQECNIKLTQASQSIEACLSTEPDNQAFNFKTSQPCLLFKRKVFSQHQNLIEYVEGTFRGDLYTYSINLY